MKLAIKIFFSMIVVISIIFALLLYLHIENTECLNLTDSEAKEMINRILKEKNSKSHGGEIIFGNKYADLMYSAILRRETESEKKSGSIELQYISKSSSLPLFTSVIYSNCEVQWIKGT